MEGILVNKMRKISLLLCQILVVILTAGYCFAEQVADIDLGKRLYDEYCSTCHGDSGIGQDPKRRAGGLDSNRVPIAPALNGTAHTWHHSPKILFKYIDKGSVMKTSPMPSFGDELNKEEILSIITYFQSLWSEKRRLWYLEKYKNE